MSVPDSTLVVGVDEYHLRQLAMTWPTWKRYKPNSILSNPMIVFHDCQQVSGAEVRAVVDHPDLRTIAWPIAGLDWQREPGKDKFDSPHRAMMLSGFVYVPALFIVTPYWLKLDTDVVATGMDDWIDPSWFVGNPAIVAHRWTFTRPADQMLRMDEWVEENKQRMPKIAEHPPLNLTPTPGWNRVGHNRIISWCGFFNTRWTYEMARLTEMEGGRYKLPVPSQDGFLWYLAERGGRKVVRANMKSRGFQHFHTWKNIENHAREAMKEG